MQEVNQNKLKHLQIIADSIRKLKNLTTINFNVGKGSFSSLFIVEDNLTKIQYTLKIISIFDDFDNICQEKLKNAKKEADFLMKCCHPNVVKYIDQFEIGLNYFILMEKCEKNLEEWFEDQNKAAISRHQLISFACQILSAIQYFHHNNFVLRFLSLKHILIDRQNRIKIYDFGQVNKIYQELCSKKFLRNCPKDTMLYFPPEIINQSNEQTLNSNQGFEQYQGDIWAFGICFIILGGVQYKEQQSIHLLGYKYITQLDEDFNQILSKILSLQPNERPSIEQIISKFEILKQKIWNLQQANILFSEYKNCRTHNIQKAWDLILICSDISPQNVDYLTEQEDILLELKYFEVKRNLGDAYLDKGMTDDAIISYQKCLQIKSKNDDCYQKLANAYQKKGMVDDAIISYEKCLELNPENDICYMNLGILYQDKGMVDKGMADKAITNYQKYLKINHQNDQCHYNLGNVYYEKNMIDEAIQSFKKCIKINPQQEEFYMDLGNAFLKKHMIDEALASYQKCVEINPKNFFTHFIFGDVYFSIGMIDKAIVSYQQCIRLNPNNQSNLDSQIKECKKKI